MNSTIFLEIIEVAAGILKNHFSGKTAEVADGVLELERLVKAGKQAVDDQAGKPIDPSLVAP